MSAFNPRKRRDTYIVVQADDGRRSGILHIWTKRSQVYVASKGHGGISKVSFHTPTYCQHAYDQNIRLPEGIPARQSSVWQRSPTPPKGIPSLSHGFIWQVPTDTLSEPRGDLPADVISIPAAPPANVTLVRWHSAPRTKTRSGRTFLSNAAYIFIGEHQTRNPSLSIRIRHHTFGSH